MVLGVRGDEEGCVVIDRWCTVNFVNEPYLGPFSLAFQQSPKFFNTVRSIFC